MRGAQDVPLATDICWAKVIPEAMRQGVHIGNWCTIGAGAVVVSDVEAEKTAVGVPARIIK